MNCEDRAAQEQIVECKGDIEFTVKLDELDFEKALVSSKQNFGHFLWSIKVLKNKKYNPPPANDDEDEEDKEANEQNKLPFVACVQFERQVDGNPVEFELIAAVHTCILIKPDGRPSHKCHDEQHCADRELMCHDSLCSTDEKLWHSSWKEPVLNRDWVHKLSNYVDSQGQVRLKAWVEIEDLSNYGHAGKPDQLLLNNRSFKVNKLILAAYSPFFRTFFLKEGFKEHRTQHFHIRDPGVDADLFGKMLNLIMVPDLDLDEEVADGLLQLADKFDVPIVKEKCEKFLMQKSKKPMIYKFRMAETYGLVSLKIHTLSFSALDEICANFGSNVDEYNKLGDRSKRTWDQHMADTVAKNRRAKNKRAHSGSTWGINNGSTWGNNIGSTWGNNIGSTWGNNIESTWGNNIGSTWGNNTGGSTWGCGSTWGNNNGSTWDDGSTWGMADQHASHSGSTWGGFSKRSNVTKDVGNKGKN